MKHLLRKYFFLDAPAQGAFFGLTLLICLSIVGLLSGCVSHVEEATCGDYHIGATPLMMPIAGCMKGVEDAWRGLPFWQLTTISEEEF